MAQQILPLVLVLIVLAVQPSAGQKRDTQLWTEVDVEIPVVKRLTALVKQEVRFDDDVSSLALYRTELGVEYKLLSFLRLSSLYRMNIKPDNTDYTAHMNVTAKADVGPLEFSWRLRLQRDLEPGKGPNDEIRNRLGIDFGSGDITPYISSEVFYFVDVRRPGFNRYRWNAGIKRKIDKQHSVQLYYMYQREIGGRETEVRTVLGVGYGFSF